MFHEMVSFGAEIPPYRVLHRTFQASDDKRASGERCVAIILSSSAVQGAELGARRIDPDVRQTTCDLTLGEARP